jgi:hypothetical protein
MLRDDLQVKLPDGTTVGYAEVGDPDGPPVLHLHGTPGSRLEVCSGTAGGRGSRHPAYRSKRDSRNGQTPPDPFFRIALPQAGFQSPSSLPCSSHDGVIAPLDELQSMSIALASGGVINVTTRGARTDGVKHQMKPWAVPPDG